MVGGDGIGPEVTAEAVRLLELVDHKKSLGLKLVPFDWGAERWLREKVGLPEGALEDLQENFDISREDLDLLLSTAEIYAREREAAPDRGAISV